MENHDISNAEVCKFAEKLCEKSGFVPKEHYPRRVDSKVMESAAERQLLVSRAINLLMRGFVLGATLPEMSRMSEYLIVLIRSIDEKLDYQLCEKELRIAELNDKYSGSDYLETADDADLRNQYIKDIMRLYGEGDVK